MKKFIRSFILSIMLAISLGLASCSSFYTHKCEVKSIISAELNSKGELIFIYSDNTKQNLSIINDLNNNNPKVCVHDYSDWEMKSYPTCTSIGYAIHTCSICGHIEYQFSNYLEHSYLETLLIEETCNQTIIAKKCCTCSNTIIEKSSGNHSYNEKGICTRCSFETAFIENDAFIENENIWWSVDRTYGIKLDRTMIYDYKLQEYVFTNWRFHSFVGNPIHVKLPETYKGQVLKDLGTAFVGAFLRCTSLNSIILPKTIENIYPWSFQECTSLNKVFLEGNPTIYEQAFFGCSDVTLYYYLDTQPEEQGNYWHYVNGKPVIW